MCVYIEDSIRARFGDFEPTSGFCAIFDSGNISEFQFNIHWKTWRSCL